MFPADISVAAAHRTRRRTIVLAVALVGACLRVLKKPGLAAAAAKCHNFMVDGNYREVIPPRDDRLNGAKRRQNQQHIQLMSQNLERVPGTRSGEREF